MLETDASNAGHKTHTMRHERARKLSAKTTNKQLTTAVAYWMQRDCRVADNHALQHARHLALEHQQPLSVFVHLSANHRHATNLRSLSFHVGGLKHVERELRALRIPFALLGGPDAAAAAHAHCAEHNIGAVITDFSPLRECVAATSAFVDADPARVVYQVDAHNVVPVWRASDKREVGARTLRPKITNQLPRFLTDDLVEAPEPLPEGHPPNAPSLLSQTAAAVDWDAVCATLAPDASVAPCEWIEPGTGAGRRALDDFLEARLGVYADKRNDPNVKAASELSPYLNYGHLSAQRMALVAKAHPAAKRHNESIKSFLEESIVRRELSDNFCFYQPAYDSLDGAAGWARETLELHASDVREHCYSLAQLEAAQSHEDIWNAAQRQLVLRGKMHGFMRMYWAKKILEWSPDPAEALRRAIFLNDKYSLDGRDPNGFVGCAWSIMGTHDMGWTERPIFGKIRFMNYNGCKRKFDVKVYAAAWPRGGGGGNQLGAYFAKGGAKPSGAAGVATKKAAVATREPQTSKPPPPKRPKLGIPGFD